MYAPSTLVRVTGTAPKHTKAFDDAMRWGSHVIFAFPRGSDMSFDGRLRVVPGKERASDVAALDARITPILLVDPSARMPWTAEDVKTFKAHAIAAAAHLRAGRKVLFLCVGGANRSKALARAAIRLAWPDETAAVFEPDDKNLALLADAIDTDDAADADVQRLAPLKPFSAVGKRSR
jgi:hypothetical protein